jgi:Fe-S-cluster containining protein
MKKTGKNAAPSAIRLPAKKLTKKQQLCIECKKCCTKVGVYTDPAIYELSEKDVIHFYETRGATVTKSDDHLFIVFDIPCPHLTLNGCKIYEKRPRICRIYSGQEEFGDECLWTALSKKKKVLPQGKSAVGRKRQ